MQKGTEQTLTYGRTGQSVNMNKLGGSDAGKGRPKGQISGVIIDAAIIQRSVFFISHFPTPVDFLISLEIKGDGLLADLTHRKNSLERRIK